MMMNTVCLLSTTYFGPVQYYAKLYAYPEVWMEAHEHYVKQTYRNRCLIASPSGVQALTVPVVKPYFRPWQLAAFALECFGDGLPQQPFL